MILQSAGLATHIMNNQIKSVLLLAGFPLLLVLMVGAFFGAMGYMTAPPDLRGADAALHAAGDGILRHGYIAFIISAVWFVIAWFFHSRMISAAAGAQPVTRQQMPKIYNMLENLCIARGIPMPQFEIIDSPALNAFASGINDKTYKIVLTRGIIESLQDDELEGVIAHELAHILNRDVRLLIISVIFVGMISFFAEMAFRMMIHGGRPAYYSRSSNNDRSGGLAVILIAAVILGIGYLFAIVIRFAISRKREYLADAGAVELTRNPDAMMRALMRISGHDKVRGMPDEVQQMCIENSHQFMGMFSTHPPIAARINAISRMTNTPVPEKLPVTLRRPPTRPWGDGQPPQNPPPPAGGAGRPTAAPLSGISSGNPWGTRR